jgi:regulator of RNase E activity RraA
MRPALIARQQNIYNEGDNAMTTLPGFRIHARPEHAIGDALLARFKGFPVANVSDAMSRTVGTTRLRPFHRREGPLVGRALTVRTRPGDNLMVHKAIDISGPGDVIVVDAGGVGPQAIIGEIMLALTIARGAAGFVIDGLIRDSDTIGKAPLPVYARGVSHRGPYKDGPGELHVPVSIDGMVVRPGDLVIGDGDGLLVVPAEEAETIAARVEDIQRTEAAILESIADGRADRAWVERSLRDKGAL